VRRAVGTRSSSGTAQTARLLTSFAVDMLRKAPTRAAALARAATAARGAIAAAARTRETAVSARILTGSSRTATAGL